MGKVFGVEVLEALIENASEISDEDYYDSILDWEPENKARLVAENLDDDLEKILRAARYFQLKSCEHEVKTNMRASGRDKTLDQWRRANSLSNLLMNLFWLLCNDRYSLWGTDTTIIFKKGNNVSLFSKDKDATGSMDSLKRMLKGYGAIPMDLKRFKRILDEMGDID